MKRVRAASVMFLLALALWPSSARGQYLFWHADQLIENNAGYAGYEPQIAISGSKAVAVWYQSDGTTNRIYSNYSTNGGKTWHADQLIENNAGNWAYLPHVALSGSRAVAVWIQAYNGYYRVFSNYSTDGGATWHADQMIQDATGGNADTNHRPWVSLSGTGVVVVWSQSDGSRYRTYANYSTDGGATWHSRQAIDTIAASGSWTPTVGLSGLNAVAAWTQSDGSHARAWANYSADGGATWHTQQLLEDNTYDVFTIQVIISGTNAVAVWDQNTTSVGRAIFSNYSTDGGATWHADQRIKDSVMGSAAYPRIAMSGSRVVAAWWQQNVSSTGLIYANYSTNSGASWSLIPYILEPDNGIAAGTLPQVALSGANALVVWSQSDGTNERIYYNYSTAGGAGWGSARMIDGVVGPAAGTPSAAISGTNAVAVWAANDGLTKRIVSNYAVNSAKQKSLLLPPKLNSPANGAVGLPTTVTLSWLDTNTNPQELKYRIRIKPAGGAYKTITLAANSVSYITSGLAKNKAYFWNVQAVGNGTSILNSGWANGGVDWKFTTAI
jgi:hypothetical protein